MQKLNLLSKTLKTFGLAKEAQSILNLTKLAFINAARIKVDVTSKKISATLVGDLPSGSTHFGECYALNLTMDYNVRLASSPSSSIWEFHREIRDPAFSGLGYMNDLLITVISQIQNNGGVAFNGIGGNIMGTTVSEYAKSHTLEKLNKSLTRTPVIVFYQPKKEYYLIFEPSDKDLAKREFLEGYGFELPDDILEDLFSTPYKTVAVKKKDDGFSHKSASYNEDDEDDEDDSYYKYEGDYKYEGVRIISAFKIVATSAKTSIPVSLSFSELEDSDADTDELESELKKLRISWFNLKREYFNLFKKSFNSSSDIDYQDLLFWILEIDSYYGYEDEELKNLTPDLVDSRFEEFIENLELKKNPDNPNDLKQNILFTFDGKSLSFDKETYLQLKPQMHSIWGQFYDICNQISFIEDKQENIIDEYSDRTKYVSQIRNKYKY